MAQNYRDELDPNRLNEISERIRRQGIAEITGPQPIIKPSFEEDARKSYNDSNAPLMKGGAIVLLLGASIAVIAFVALLALIV